MKFFTLMMILSLGIASAFAQEVEPKVIALDDKVTGYLHRVWGISSSGNLTVKARDYEPMRATAITLSSSKQIDGLNREVILMVELANHYAAVSLGEFRNATWGGHSSYTTGKCMYLRYQREDSSTNVDSQDKIRAVYFDLTVVDGHYQLESYLITPKIKYGFRNEDEMVDICKGTKSLSELTDSYTAEAFDLKFLK